jgi:hypothetical protein
VRPIPDETVDSYLSRLAAANHITTSALAAHLGTRLSTVATKVPLPALAMASRQSAAVLARALPQLRDQHPHDGPTKSPVAGSHSVRPLCRHCAAARGITTPVPVWCRPEHKICMRHQLWIGDAVTTAAEQVDLAAHPDVVRAQIRHHRLTRRFGRHTTDIAYRCAREAWLDVTWRGYHQPYQTIRHLNPAHRETPWRIHTDDPAYQAGNYPETLTLAALIAQPCWRDLAQSGSDNDSDRFHAELWRRLPSGSPIPQARLHNLATLVRHTAQQAGWPIPLSTSTEQG